MIRARRESIQDRIPNLAPMVDVIMVLLIFFMLGASLNLIREGVIQTELDPRAGPGEGAAIEIIPVVKIALESADGGASCHIYVMGERIPDNTFAGLRKLLDARRAAGADTKNPIVIGAESDVRWNFVIAAMDAAIAARFANVQFAVALK